MTKLAIKSENITSCGVLFHVMDVFFKLELVIMIASIFGKRGDSDRAYPYNAVIFTVLFSFLCGSNFLEYINVLYLQLSMRPGTSLPNTNTLSCGLKGLA